MSSWEFSCPCASEVRPTGLVLDRYLYACLPQQQILHSPFSVPLLPLFLPSPFSDHRLSFLLMAHKPTSDYDADSGASDPEGIDDQSPQRPAPKKKPTPSVQNNFDRFAQNNPDIIAKAVAATGEARAGNRPKSRPTTGKAPKASKGKDREAPSDEKSDVSDAVSGSGTLITARHTDNVTL